jgi:hypothetical protein
MMRVYIGLHFYAGKNLCFMFFYDVEYVDNNFNGELHKTLVTKRGAVPLDPVLRAMTRCELFFRDDEFGDRSFYFQKPW